MSTIKVDIEKIKQLESQLERLPGKIENAATTVNSVRKKLDWDIACEQRIDYKLRDIAERLDRCYTRMQQTVIFLEDAAEQYSQVEATNTELFNVSLIQTSNSIQGLDIVEQQGRDIAEVVLTEQQEKAILEALRKNDKEAAMIALGLSVSGTKSAEEEAIIDTLWDALCQGFKDNILKNYETGFRDEVLSSGGNWVSQIFNTCFTIGRGPETTNSFVLLDDILLEDTHKNTAKILDSTRNVSKGLNVGLAILGGVLDFAEMKLQGEDMGEALFKATAHASIGFAGGKAGAAIGSIIGSVIPGAGTVVGAVVGTAIGVVATAVVSTVITSVGNAAFDTMYDNRETIVESIVADVGTSTTVGTIIGSVIPGAGAVGGGAIGGIVGLLTSAANNWCYN